MKPCTFQKYVGWNKIYVLRYRYQDIEQIEDKYNFEVAIVKLIVKKILLIRIQIRY